MSFLDLNEVTSSLKKVKSNGAHSFAIKIWTNQRAVSRPISKLLSHVTTYILVKISIYSKFPDFSHSYFSFLLYKQKFTET